MTIMEPKGTVMKSLGYPATLLVLIMFPPRLGAQTQASRNLAVGGATAGEVAVADITPSHSGAPSRNSVADLAAAHALYVKVQIPESKKSGALKPGQTVEGKLMEPVYSGSQELFPSESGVALTVGGFQRCRKAATNRWPGVAAIFRPRYTKCPTFESGRVFPAGGQEVPLRLSLISIGHEKHVSAKTHAKTLPVSGVMAHQGPNDIQLEPAPQRPGELRTGKHAGLVLVFKAEEASGGDDLHTAGEIPSSGPASTVPAIAAGTAAKVILLDSLSASKSHPGDLFRARLIEPVRDGTVVILPEGSVLEGTVAKAVPPRILSRSGSMLLNFNRLILPDGSPATLSASVTGAELDQSSEAHIDPEGGVHGSRPGTLWMLINLGTTAGIAKLADDGTQLLIQALVSTATDASTAGTARIVSTCVSGVFLVTRRGRDVVLPQFTEMDVAFNHPFSLTRPQADLLMSTPTTRERR